MAETARGLDLVIVSELTMCFLDLMVFEMHASGSIASYQALTLQSKSLVQMLTP